MPRSAVGRIGTSGGIRTYSKGYTPPKAPRRLKKTVHVHQAKMRRGEPAIIVKTYKGSSHHRYVRIHGRVEIKQLEEPDSCGARVVLVTHAAVYGDGKQVGT